MISTDSIEDPDHVTTRDELIVAQLKARRASARANLALAFVVIAAVITVAIVSVSSARQSQDNGDRVDNLVTEAVKLRQDVRDLQAQVDASRATSDAVDACDRKLAADVRDTTRDYNASLGQLVVTLRPLSAGAPGQDAVIDQAIENLNEKLGLYLAATDRSSMYGRLPDDERKTAPCPV